MAGRVLAIFDASKACSPLSIPLDKTALLLMDYQNLIVAGMGEAGPRTVQVAQQMRDWARQNRISIFHCLVATSPDRPPAAGFKVSDRWHVYADKVKEMPQMANEAEELAASSDSENEKTSVRTPGFGSALYCDGVRETLKARSIRSLIICGLSTSGCVLSTARGGTDEGFIVTVVEDACADPTPGLHDTLCNVVLPSTAHIASAKEIEEVWRK